MSIEQKIAEILAESTNEDTEDVMVEDVEDLEEEDLDEDLEEEFEEDLDEETDISDPSKGGSPNPDNSRNDARSQNVGGKGKAINVVNKRAASPEAMKKIKEDVEALVEGEDLSEEFKQKAATIFEAAVTSRVREELEHIEEAYNDALQEEVEAVTEGLIEKVDGYLDYVVEQWMEQNEIALETGMRTDILEGFVSGLRDLFVESYIEVPEEKVDFVDALEEHVDSLSETLDEQVAANIELREALLSYQRAEILDELAEGLTLSDHEKFVDLMEEVEFEDVETFAEKAQTIRESYFGTGSKPKSRTLVESIVSDEPVMITEEGEEISTDPSMKGYLATLDRLKK